MPTYEYVCKDCGTHTEVVQSFTDDALTECPHCGGRLRKVFGNVGISFKGSGFYKTDSRSGTSSKTSTADSSASTSSGGTSDGPSKGADGATATPAKDKASSGSSSTDTSSGKDKGSSGSGSSGTKAPSSTSST
jgi:putative FmdB family regulatory protein